MNLVGDKAFAEVLPEAPAEEVATIEAAATEEIDLESALGGGIRKAPAAVAALIEDAEVAEAGV